MREFNVFQVDFEKQREPGFYQFPEFIVGLKGSYQDKTVWFLKRWDKTEQNRIFHPNLIEVASTIHECTKGLNYTIISDPEKVYDAGILLDSKHIDIKDLRNIISRYPIYHSYFGLSSEIDRILVNMKNKLRLDLKNIIRKK